MRVGSGRELVERAPPLAADGSLGVSPWRFGWLLALVIVALLHILLGVAGLGAAFFAGTEFTAASKTPHLWRLVIIAVFSGLASYLLLGARRDIRVAYLGALFLLVAVFFAHDPIAAIIQVLPPTAARAALVVRSIPIESFLPAVAWLLVRDFPRALAARRATTLVNAAIFVSFAMAIVLVVLAVAGPVNRGDIFGIFQAAVFGMLLPVLPFMAWRTRHAPVDERRRAGLFACGLGLAGLPAVLFALLPALIPGLPEIASGPFAQKFVVPFNQGMLLAMAGTTAYSVLVDHVLDVRTTLRTAAQYALARIAVAMLAGLPFAFVAILIYELRDKSLAEIFSGTRPLPIVGLLVLGVSVLRLRQRVMLGVDRLFFREPYEPQSILAALTERILSATSASQIAQRLGESLGEALHVESMGVAGAPPDREDYLPLVGGLRPLPAGSEILAILSRSPAPLVVDLDRRTGVVTELPREDREWLADAAARVLVPMRGADRRLRALLVVGPKQSELPFSREDLLLLEAAGSTAGLAIDARVARDSSSAKSDAALEGERASECIACGAVAVRGTPRCSACGGALQDAALPIEVSAKFQLSRRLGQGSMGVVYLATDQALAREVALKTLPATRPEDAIRLRREARAMAAITHPHLALIHGVESWRGTPVLVIEYLAGGTLADRLERQPMGVRDALGLGAVMARVLERAHGAGILHRDIKPSNIGFTDDGRPKLLDFGLVRIAEGVGVDEWSLPAQRMSDTGLAGTPLYMAPEALAVGRPEPGFDLWSLAVVAYEAATGTHPFERNTWAESLRAIRSGWTPAHAGALDGAIDARDFFERALASDPAKRPATAAEIATDLESLSTALA